MVPDWMRLRHDIMVYQVPGILFSERLKSGYLVFVCLCAFFFFRQEVEGEEEGGQGRHAGGAAGNGNAQGAPYADDMLSVGSERSVVSEVRWYCIICSIFRTWPHRSARSSCCCFLELRLLEVQTHFGDTPLKFHHRNASPR